MMRIVNADVVSVLAECDLSGWCQTLPVKDSHGPVSRIRDVDVVAGGHITDPLRCLEARERPDHLARLQVQHPDAVIAELCHIQTLATHIDRQMIDPAPHVAEWNFPLQLEGRRDRRARLRGDAQCDEQPQHDHFTITQAGWISGKATRPAAAVTAIRRGLAIRQRKSASRARSPMSTVNQSPMAMRPRRTQAPRIVPMAAE